MLHAVLVNFCPLSTTAGAQLKSPLLHPEGWGEDWEKRTHNWLYCLIFQFYLLNDWVEEPDGRIFDSRSWARAKHFPVLNIMWKLNRVIVLLYIFLKQSAKEDTSLWVCKSLRTFHGRGAWKLGILNMITQYLQQILGYHVNFTHLCTLSLNQS